MNSTTAETVGYDIDDTISFEDEAPGSSAPREDCEHQPTPSVYYTQACTITSGLCPS